MASFFQTYRFDFKQTLILSTPIIIGQLGHILMGVFDNAMVGSLEPVEYGAIAVAAAGVSNAIFFLVTVLGIGIMMAVSTLVSISKSKKENTACGEYLKYSIVASVLTSILLSGILVVCAYNFHIFQQPPAVEELAIDYFLLISISTFPLFAGFGVKNFTDGLSYTKPAMVVTLLGVVLNIFLNWLFIFGNWGMPALGLNGAGVATISSRIFIFVALLVYVFKSQLFKEYRKMEKGISLKSPHLKEIFKLGLPSGLQYFFEIGAFTAANIMAGWLGAFQSAAHQIALTLAAVSYMVSLGISTAGSIRVSTAYGDNDLQAAKRAGYSALFMISAFMLVSAIVFLTCNTVLPPLFNAQETVVRYAATLLLITALFQFSDGAQAVGLGILRGLKDVKYPTGVTLIAYWLIGLPFAYFFAFTLKMDVQGIWYGLTIGLTISAIFLTRRFIVLVNRS